MSDLLNSIAWAIHATPGAYALLLGSGISRSSGIPTGWDITLQLVRELAEMDKEDCGTAPEVWYKAKYGHEPRYEEMVRQIGFAPEDRSGGLKRFIEPTEEEREEGSKKPTLAHHAIARLMRKGYIRVVVTTNFDRLLEEALATEGVNPTVLSSDDSLGHHPPLRHLPCAILKLHGDYLAGDTRNIEEELADYPDRTKQLLSIVFDEYGLIVCGWSAEWDKKLAQILLESNPKSYSRVWAKRGDLTPAADEIVQKQNANLCDIMDADTFFTQLEAKVQSIEDLAGSRPSDTKIAVQTLKRYLRDPQQVIRVHDLLHDETARLVERLHTSAYFNSQDYNTSKAELDECIQMLQTPTALVIAGCRWGLRDFDETFIEMITRVACPPPSAPDHHCLQKWQLFPALYLCYAAGVASIASGDNGRVARLLTGIRVKTNRGMEPTQQEFQHHKIFEKETLNGVLGQNSTYPVSVYLHTLLYEPLKDYLPLQEEYDRCFHLFEYWFGLMQFDVEREGGTSKGWGQPGNFLLRHKMSKYAPDYEKIKTQATTQNSKWEPFRYGILGGNTVEFLKIHREYHEFLAKISGQPF